MAPTTTLPRLSGAYLWSGPSGVIFLQITMVNQTTMQGSVAFHAATSSGMITEQNHFTGAISSSGDITLRFDPMQPDAWHLGRSWSGSINSDRLSFTIYIQQNNGTLGAAAFAPATAADFDAAVKRSNP
jgi:hypothetical protein